ncbi:MAG: hypothetical protein R6X20_02505 [Phycisphaerae bacterium]
MRDNGVPRTRTTWRIVAGMALAAIAAGAAGAASGEETGRGIPIRFALDKSGYVTLVVEDGEGVRVRNLIQDTPFEAGAHTIYWDGYNQGEKWVHPPKEPGSRKDAPHYSIHRGRVEPGTYRVRGLIHDDVALRYLTPVHSPGDPPWHTADGSGAWLADHTPPGKVLFLPAGSPHGAEPQLHVTAAGSAECGHSAMWLTVDGRKRYGTKIGHGISSSGVALARDDGPQREKRYYMYALIPVKRKGLFLYGFRRDVDPAEGHAAMYRRLARVETPPVPDEGWPWLAKNARTSIAVHNGAALVGCPWAGQVHVFQVRGEKAEPRGVIDVPGVRGMAFDGQGRLFVAAGVSLRRYDRPRPLEGELGPATTLASDLDDPNELTVDADGRVYVSQAGDSHQVRVFAVDGKALRTIGKPGGRRLGVYDEERMHNPAGIAVDAEGKLWVCEAGYAPKRISLWEAATGRFIRAFYGPPRYGGGGHLDPRDRTRFYYPSGGQGIEYILDYKNQTSRPHAIYWLKDHSSGRAPGAVLWRDGRRYLVNCFVGPSYFLAGRLDVFRYDPSEGVARIIASLGDMGRKSMGRLDVMTRALEADSKVKAKIEQAEKPFVAWSDLNLDGAVQADEVQTGRFDGGLMFGRDLSVCSEAGWALPAPRITDRGVPVWDLSSASRFADESPRWLGNALRVDEETHVMSPGWGGWGNDPMTAWRDGRRQWVYHTQLGGLAVGPQFRGQLILPKRCIGFPFEPAGGRVGPMFAVNGYRGSIFVFTADGLYVTDLGGNVRTKPLLRLPEARPGRQIDDVSFNDEHFWPAINRMADGSIYLAAGKEFTGIFEVEGLETARPVGPFDVEVTAEMLEGLPAVRVDPPLPDEGEKTLTVRIADAAPTVDGRLDHWAAADWADISPRRQMRGALMVHDGTLYAAWQTDDPNLLDSDLPEGWRHLFATGGGLDLMFRTRPDAETQRLGKRPGSRFDLASEGDIRLLVTRQGDPADGPVKAVRFQQVGDGPGEPVEYVSPVGEVRFDAVADVSRHVTLAHSGGAYELAVPLSVLGLDVKPGLATRGDIGVLVGNGMETRVRLYWANKTAGIVSDVPSEAKLTPAEWGQFKFE